MYRGIDNKGVIMKAKKVSGGDTAKGYYQLTLEHGFSGWITKPICEKCWVGRKLKA